MSERDSAWLWATILTLLFLLTGEVYGAYDTEWVYQRYFAVFLSLQYVEVAIAFVVYHGTGRVGDQHDLSRIISYYLNALCFLVGFKACFITAYTLGECQRLDSHTIDRARSCIDVYLNFASINGPMGSSTACASLDVSVEIYMGGVCPNVNQSQGTAILVIQMVLTMLITVFNIGKFTVLQVTRKKDDGETMKSPPNYSSRPTAMPVKAPAGPFRQKVYSVHNNGSPLRR